MRDGSPSDCIPARGVINARQNRQEIKGSLEETALRVAHELERCLNTWGTIAAISPLLGSSGTVIGLMQTIESIMQAGVGDLQQMAGGGSVALITTAGSLIVAILSLFFYRYRRGQIDDLVIGMAAEALKLVEVMRGNRCRGPRKSRSTPSEISNRPNR